MDVRTLYRMPGSVKFGLITLWIQVLIMAFAGWFILSEIDTRHDHGQSVQGEGAVRSIAYGMFVLCAALLVASGLFFRRSLLACKLVYGYEVFTVVIALLSIGVALAADGFVLAQLAALALPFAVCWALGQQSADEWFSVGWSPADEV
ncbi:hypothetical protein [Streptomyces zagrosensis]|uniref:Putative membrane protein n=1 Tax=Streptomyces zagrosensis TaxID=1042984 RepID=A0A7W9QCI5_9ACTN|nr:hypothetical protein [Streptomyces zagrosensis]MBB5937258.1 putative membrane protein [Streptomyces zagrosensis]